MFLQEISPYFKLISELCELGEVPRQILIKYLLDKEYYQRMNSDEASKCPNGINTKMDRFKNVEFKEIEYPNEFYNKNLVSIDPQNMLDEFVYWWIHLKTKSDLSQFMINFLYDNKFKEEFVRSLFSKFLLIDSLAFIYDLKFHSKLDLENVWCQYYHVRGMCEKVLTDYNLLEVLLVAIYNLCRSQSLLTTGKIEMAEDEENME